MATPNSFKCYACGFWTTCIKTITQHIPTCTRSGSVIRDAGQIVLRDEVSAVLAREQEEGQETRQNPDELDDPQSSYGWPMAATQLLIETYRDHKHDFNHPNKKKYTVWKDIAEKLQSKGYAVDGAACDTKMRSLKRRYKLIKDRASKTGRGASRPWQFYTAMDDLMDGDPSVHPIALKSSLPIASPSSSSSSFGAPIPSTSGLQASTHPSDFIFSPSPTTPSPAPSPNTSYAPIMAPTELPSTAEEPQPKRRRREGNSGISQALIQSQDKAIDRIIASNEERKQSVQGFLEMLVQGKSSSTSALEQCMKEKEDLQRRYDQLHELVLKEKKEHEEKVAALHEKIEKILVKHKEEMQEINNHHQEQLMQVY